MRHAAISAKCARTPANIKGTAAVHVQAALTHAGWTGPNIKKNGI